VTISTSEKHPASPQRFDQTKNEALDKYITKQNTHGFKCVFRNMLITDVDDCAIFTDYILQNFPKVQATQILSAQQSYRVGPVRAVNTDDMFGEYFLEVNALSVRVLWRVFFRPTHAANKKISTRNYLSAQKSLGPMSVLRRRSGLKFLSPA
jgi:hypothetical protein